MRDGSCRKEALGLFPELESIEAELEVYESLLRRWQAKINLVSAATLDEIWLRHFADSAQVHAVAPQIRCWADMGTGAGFPGLVTALLLKSTPQAVVHLIESDQRKAGFLRAVSRETGAPAIIHAERIESVLPNIAADVGGVSARALAPLSRLVQLAEAPLKKGAIGVFLKGEEWRDELTAVEALGSLSCESADSRTRKGARVVVVKHKASQ
ncbi:16S rRNA (guanine(527)-N(7))-methyltransferase RsmG [Methylocystis sp. SC2]|uniref:16S rRNA (guanine(527)-N(7))-methyltransferase RsmG n=1 Tax=Methylocystis sp. (strain SC2) TaxID=187303 RepID=UPI00027AEF43|nr:16S rRNA (guanine(527)-N(7))-methyltransferase RsmG [Methylocystis sp. SC2]CCJ07623.1 Ribosomal RNA small subunit methyltransferase G [Methylocystis sp. SC2]